MNAPAQQTLAHDAMLASENVLKSAVALARAEAKLFALRARAELIGALLLGVGAAMAGLFVALCLVIFALSPLVVGRGPGSVLGSDFTPVGVSLGISAALAASGAIVAWLGIRRLRAGVSPTYDQDRGDST
jgi:hypothetical protein